MLLSKTKAAQRQGGKDWNVPASASVSPLEGWSSTQVNSSALLSLLPPGVRWPVGPASSPATAHSCGALVGPASGS